MRGVVVRAHPAAGCAVNVFISRPVHARVRNHVQVDEFMSRDEDAVARTDTHGREWASRVNGRMSSIAKNTCILVHVH